MQWVQWEEVPCDRAPHAPMRLIACKETRCRTPYLAKLVCKVTPRHDDFFAKSFVPECPCF
eukprot:m.378748 g.378748  ORF g.378748 m.378748 type:complete len:61 (+) comp20937_c0_seq5:122-304(+)